MNNYFVKVNTDMESEVINVDSLHYSKLAEQIGCEYIEMASINRLNSNPRLCMLVDEDGSLRQDRKINTIASSLYGYVIYGDVLFGQESLNKHGFRDYDSLDLESANLFHSMFTEIKEKINSGGKV